MLSVGDSGSEALGSGMANCGGSGQDYASDSGHAMSASAGALDVGGRRAPMAMEPLRVDSALDAGGCRAPMALAGALGRCGWMLKERLGAA